MDKGCEDIQMTNKYMQKYAILLNYLNLSKTLVRFHFSLADGQVF